MLETTIKIRVRYAETDKMGYVYYGNYATYFEVARTELLRSIGLVYNDLENKNIMLPVSSFLVDYKSPAYYDDLLSVKVIIVEKPTGVRVNFDYEIYADSRLICTAKTRLIFVDALTKKPIRIPEFIAEKFNTYFDK